MSTDGTWVHVGSRADVESRRARRVNVAGRWVALHMWNGEVRAIGDECPHRGATLSIGAVTADGYVGCPEHGWEYSLLTGCGRESFEGAVARYEVREEHGEVYVRPAAG